MIELSLVVPVFNEEKKLENTVKELLSFLRKHFRNNFEIIISEDGSTDRTYQIALTLSKRFSNVRIIKNKHVGKGNAILRGFEHSRGKIIGFTDVDLATDLNCMPRLVEKIMNGADIAIGSRYADGNKNVERNFERWFVSKAYNLMIQILFLSKIKDHQCGFKFFNKSSTIKLMRKVKNKKFVWDSELLIRAQKDGYKIAEVFVNWKEKKGGTVKIGRGSLEMLLDVLRLWKNLNF